MSGTDEEYWEKIGRENPYWGVLSQDKFLGADLDAARKDEFMAQGVRDIDYAVALIRRHTDGEFAPVSALDFGCGVGRLVVAMSRVAQNVTGVDVSKNMLARAAANARASGASNVRFSETISDERFDWINSFIVFQHIAPRKGMALLETLLSRLSPGGIVSLHFTVYRDNRIWYRGIQESQFGRYDGETYVNFSRGDLRDMPIYEYDLSEIVCRLTAHGLNTLTMRHLDHQGLHGVWIVGRQDQL